MAGGTLTARANGALSNVQGQLSGAEAPAQHQSVRAQIAALSSDIGTLISSLQAIENGDVSQASQMEAVVTKLQNDGNALDSTCSTL